MPVLRFIEPCLPSPADRPPSGANWIHEIKHDGYRLMARRDPVGIRLITRRGNDWSERFPLLVAAVNHLKVRSCLNGRRGGALRRAGNDFSVEAPCEDNDQLDSPPLASFRAPPRIFNGL
jgi:hypothetical protein